MTSPVIGGTTSQARTDSFEELEKTVRKVLLDYVNDVSGSPHFGKSARDLIGERLHIDSLPDGTPSFPCAVMRLQTSSVGRMHGMKLDGDLELLVHGKPRTQRTAVSAVADLFDQCMISLCENRHGLIICHGNSRLSMPRGTDPVDSEVTTTRLTYTLSIWPAFLTSLTRVLT